MQSVAAERKSDVLVFFSEADAEKQTQLEKLGIRLEKVPAVMPDGRPRSLGDSAAAGNWK